MKLDDTEYKKYADWQVSQLRGGDADFWERLSEDEYQAVAPFIGEPKHILDLGCGLGRVSAHFSKYITSPPTTYYLADSTGTDPTWEWNAGDGFYNDLSLTAKFVQEQGLKQFELVDLQTDALDKLKGIELVMSFLAVGFHYPIRRYLDRLMKITTPDARLIFGIRRGTMPEEKLTKLAERFSSVDLVEGTTVDKATNKRIKEDILILRK